MYRFIMFDCLCEVFLPTREFFTHMKTSPLPLKDCKFWPIFDTYGHWPVRVHLLWQGTSVYNGHLREPVTLTIVAGRLSVKLSLPVLTTWACRGRDSNTKPAACETNALSDCATAANIYDIKGLISKQKEIL